VEPEEEPEVVVTPLQPMVEEVAVLEDRMEQGRLEE
jgi:hypothetical protein